MNLVAIALAAFVVAAPTGQKSGSGPPIGPATTTRAGTMSAADKVKLDTLSVGGLTSVAWNELTGTTGTPSAATFLRGDGAWAAGPTGPAGAAGANGLGIDEDGNLVVPGTFTSGGGGGTGTVINVTAITVAQLAAVATPTTGDFTPVSNGLDTSDCTAGGGTVWHWCRYSGIAWVAATGPTGPAGPQGPTGPEGPAGSTPSGTPNKVLATDTSGSSSNVATLRALVAADLPLAPVTVANGGTITAAFGYYFATGTTTFTLPATAAGKQFCVRQANAATNLISVTPPASSYVEATDGGSYCVVSHAIRSGGANGDLLCLVAIDATHWAVQASKGTWTCQ